MFVLELVSITRVKRFPNGTMILTMKFISKGQDVNISNVSKLKMSQSLARTKQMDQFSSLFFSIEKERIHD